MGYECPVCDTPQADRRHLADHLAVTAMTHGDDHERWLDETVPDWAERSPADLGAAVADHAVETEYDRVFEDTVGTRGDHGHGHDHGDADASRGLEDAVSETGRGGDRTEESREVLEEARELTREMLATDDDETDATDDGEGDDE